MTGPDTSPAVQGVTAEPAFRFKRFVRGTLMAEGVTIEGVASLAEAVSIAARICPARSGTVLILDDTWGKAAAQVRAGQDGEVERLKRQLAEERQRTHTMAAGRQDWRHAAEVAEARATAAEEANERLRSVLRGLEWSANAQSPYSLGFEQFPICPSCGGWKPRAGADYANGHASDCILAAALLADPATDTAGDGAKDLRDLAEGAVFHFFCCGAGVHTQEDECGQFVPAMADLAKTIGFECDPVTQAEIAAIPESDSTKRRRALASAEGGRT